MVVSVAGAGTAERVTAITDTTEVECLSVYAAYQTMRGPIDSIGFFFLCVAEGEATGSDESERGSWFGLEQVARLLEDDASSLSWVDAAGLKFHLRAAGITT